MKRFFQIFTLVAVAALGLTLVACNKTTTTAKATTRATTAEQATTTEAQKVTTEAPTTDAPTTVAPVTEAPTTTEEVTTTEHVHEFGDWTVTTEATCTQEGVKTRTCACGETETEAIPMVAHTLAKVEAVAGTDCQTKGTIEHYTCSVCSKMFSDAEGKNEIASAEGEVGPHTYVKTEAVEPTWDTAGNIEYYTCSVCNKVFVIDSAATTVTYKETTADEVVVPMKELNYGTADAPLDASTAAKEAAKMAVGETNSNTAYVKGYVVSGGPSSGKYNCYIADADGGSVTMYALKLASTDTIYVGSYVEVSGNYYNDEKYAGALSGATVLKYTNPDISAVKYGTADAPITVADGLENGRFFIQTSSDYAYVMGYVLKSESKNLYIYDGTDETKTIDVYNSKFTADQFTAGTLVVVKGKYQNYFGKIELTNPTVTTVQYTVTFDTNGGSAIDAVKVDYGTSAAALASVTTTKAGYTFAGWLLPDGSAVTADMTVTQDITVWASWTIIEYTASIVVEYDTASNSSVTYTVENSADKLASISALLPNADDNYEYSWKEALPATLPLENGSYTITRSAHTWTVVEGTTADTIKCSTCERVHSTYSFNKALSDTVARQDILMTGGSSIVLTGVSEYQSLKSIVYGEISLGASLTELTISDDLKNAAHGEQDLIVTVTDAYGDHKITVPVTLVDAAISDFETFKYYTMAIKDGVLKNEGKYYILTQNIDAAGKSVSSYTDTDGETKCTTVYTGYGSGFAGTVDGRGYAIYNLEYKANSVNEWRVQGLFGGLVNATIKNITFTLSTLSSNGNFGLFGWNIKNSKVTDVKVNVPRDCACEMAAGFFANQQCDGAFTNVTLNAVGSSFTYLLGKGGQALYCTTTNVNVICKSVTYIYADVATKEGVTVTNVSNIASAATLDATSGYGSVSGSDKLTDGDYSVYGMRWDGQCWGAYGTQSATFTFTEATAVKSVAVNVLTDASSTAYPTVKLEYLDASGNWVTLSSIDVAKGPTSGENHIWTQFDLSGISTTGIRLTFTMSVSGQLWCADEIEVYA